MSQGRGVKKSGGERKRESKLPRIGETREEIQQTLMETMHGILDGRITSKEAWRIGHACNAQLKLLGLIERLEKVMEGEKRRAPGDRFRVSGDRRNRNRKGGPPWVN